MIGTLGLKKSLNLALTLIWVLKKRLSCLAHCRHPVNVEMKNVIKCNHDSAERRSKRSKGDPKFLPVLEVVASQDVMCKSGATVFKNNSNVAQVRHKGENSLLNP